MSIIEEKVALLAKLRAEANELESGMREMRLGAKHEYRWKEMWWREMVIAFGWSERKSEQVPPAIQRRFYDFLAKERVDVQVKIVDVEKWIAERDEMAA